MMKQFVMISLFLGIFVVANAQNKKYKPGVKIPYPVCYASDKVEKARIGPPKEFLLKSTGSAKSEILVDYIGFSEEAQVAFQYAVDIWESIIESEVPIRMKAVWSGRLDKNVLGSCGPETYYSNFKDAPFEDRYYPVAIAEKISKSELNGKSRYDMNANFNKNIDWYLGIDLECPDTLYDFVSVVMHEIGHGLGFTGFFSVTNDAASYDYYDWGDATSFDLLVLDAKGQQLVDSSFFENPSAGLKDALTGNVMFANSPVAKSRNKGSKPRLYAPGTFDDGSSVYHLNDANYPHGNVNSLMTHAVGKAEAIHDPGPLTRGIMDDIGWRNLFIRHNPVKDKKELQEIEFNVSLESDYKIDSSALYVIYSKDGFESHSDTLNLVSDEEKGAFRASLMPESGIDSITYYIQAADTLKRVRTSPSIAPKKLHSVKFGPDNESPVITHSPIPYFLLMGEPLNILVDADDNLGIDTVYIEFSINGEAQTPFGLTKVAYGKYSGIFSVSYDMLKDGDTIEYTIFAQDSSLAKNGAQLPLDDDKFAFRVEEIYEPVTSYANDFNNETSDFLIYDFVVKLEEGFENGSLHSPHPYLSPGKDNHDINYSTFLKRPIILKESGTMSFDEVVLVEPAEPESVFGDDDFWDYVIVEASKDFGETWYAILDGYDSNENLTWQQNYNENIVKQRSKAIGTSEWYVNREVDLLGNSNFSVGDTVLFRFRLYSDPYASGWGWTIDNLRIQQPLSTSRTILSPGNVMVYPNPFTSSVKVNISSIQKSADIQIEVFDMFGNKVYSELTESAIGEMEKTIHLANLSSGMFFIQVSENGKRLLSKKLIKN